MVQPLSDSIAWYNTIQTSYVLWHVGRMEYYAQGGYGYTIDIAKAERFDAYGACTTALRRSLNHDPRDAYAIVAVSGNDEIVEGLLAEATSGR